MVTHFLNAKKCFRCIFFWDWHCFIHFHSCQLLEETEKMAEGVKLKILNFLAISICCTTEFWSIVFHFFFFFLKENSAPPTRLGANTARQKNIIRHLAFSFCLNTFYWTLWVCWPPSCWQPHLDGICYNSKCSFYYYRKENLSRQW